MIVVKDNPISEYYASITIPRWEMFGYEVKVFNATTPETKTNFDLAFGKVSTLKYKIILQAEKTFTPTEKAIWYSHVSLWLKAIELNQNIMVLEHDCYLIHPDKITLLNTVDFVAYDKGALGCYVISPRFASFMCNELVNKKESIIRCGPLGYIRAVIFKMIKENKNVYHTIFHDDLQYQQACNQIYNPLYKTTITHYKNTEAENKLDDIGYFEYILAETNNPIDPTKTIKVRTE